ncbi:MAG: NAD-dependent epimerase/dehydratase family protein [Saprospiraceae bacterium]|nr:NAD-dependent epimerase/dehydratase family protein [Saprospiraceae bacterium]
MSKTIAILGCGWLGLPLGGRLVDLGFVVKGSTTSAPKRPKLSEAGIQPYVFKVGNSIEGSIDDFFVADILILNIPPGRRNPKVEQEHPAQVQLVIEEAMKGGVQQVVFVSSSSVYGNYNGTVTEATPPQPETASGRALAQAEQWLTAQSLASTIVRMAGLYGPHRHPARFLAGKKEVKNGGAPINLVHLEEAMEAVIQVIQREKWNEVFNICADDHPSRATYYTAKAKELELPPPEFAKEDSYKYKIVSNEKAKQELGLTFRPLVT